MTKTQKTIETTRTELGCNVRTVIHEDGQEAITLDTGSHPVLRIVGVDMARPGTDRTAYYFDRGQPQ